MKIANINFKKAVSGMYISDDEKGIVIDMFELTGFDKGVDFTERAMH